MDDEKLKMVVAVLSGLIFSLVFILMAFILPLDPPKSAVQTMDEKLQKLSESYAKNKPSPHPAQQSSSNEHNLTTKE